MGHRKRKPRKCRICKKNPVWRGGDVKDPGPFCKRCYHKHVSPGRQAGRRPTPKLEPFDEIEPVDAFNELSWEELILDVRESAGEDYEIPF